MHLRERAQAVKRGVWEAGGYPVEMPVATLSETFQKPTPMLYRNLLAMDTEEMLRSYPFDGAVLMGGCDKSTPALLMGAASVDRPIIYVPAGPMLTGHWRGETLGSGTDMWRFWDEKRAGTISEAEWDTLESAHGTFSRPVHDDGHGLDDDRGRRGARAHAAGRVVDPGGRLGSSPHGRRERLAHRRDGRART